jgi:hypothetical protein
MSEAPQAAPAAADNAAPAAETPAAAAPAPAPNAAPAPAPVPDTPAAAPAGTDLNGSDQSESGTNNDWLASLDDDNKALVQDKGWKDLNAPLKSYKELQAKLGEKVLAPPDHDAGQDEWNDFYSKMGRPEAPGEYNLPMPEGTPENIPYDRDFADKFKNWAHEAGLSPKQAQTLHDQYVKDTVAKLGNSAESRVAEIESAHKAIVEKWGDPETDGYKRQNEMARRAMVQLGLKDELMSAGVIDAATGMIAKPNVALALARVGATMFAEDSMYSGPSSMGTNPFSAKEFNMTQQSLMIKNDPSKAATLIKAAGQNPAEFGLSEA